MATSKQQVYRNALLILKESPVSVTVTDDTVAINTFNVVYDSALASVLESGKWNFASRAISIEADADTEPGFGYSYAFEKPSDYANLIKLASNAAFYPPFGANEYADEAGYWFANCDPLFAVIVSNGSQYGASLTLWPQVIANVLEYEIAFRAGPHITSMGEQALDQLEKRKMRAMAKAKSWDASKQAPEAAPPSRLATARRGTLGRQSFRD